MSYSDSKINVNLSEVSQETDSKINSITPFNNFDNEIREQMPTILDILLIDRSSSTLKTKKNIIWANENYLSHGVKAFASHAQIKRELVTGKNAKLITPRALKTRELQKERTKSRAEVFTPIWIVKQQNELIEKNYLNDDLETYIRRKWLEISCGEAPYMVTRYDAENGEYLAIKDRVGFVDKKLSRINMEVKDKAEWQRLIEIAYKSSYGFEWNGDSLLIARENLLYTYRDYYYTKWRQNPSQGLLEKIAEIISYNIFQMDGISKKYGTPKKNKGSYYILPLSEKKQKKIEVQLSLDLDFEDNFDDSDNNEFTIIPGKRVRIMNWETNRMEYFDKGVN